MHIVYIGTYSLHLCLERVAHNLAKEAHGNIAKGFDIWTEFSNISIFQSFKYPGPA